MPPRKWTPAERAAARSAQKSAHQSRAAAIARLSSGDLDFEGVLDLAVLDKAVGRLRMHKVLETLGWKQVQFSEATNSYELPTERHLEWWIGPRGKAPLDALRQYMSRINTDRKAEDGFPFRRPGDQIPVR